MAFSRKSKRRITLDGVQYFYAVTGNDGYIHVCIMTEIEGSPRLSAYFDYHHDLVPFQLPDGTTGTRCRNQLVVTPYTVRQVIRYALDIGWNPLEKGKDVALGHVDDKIDLRLETNRADVIKAKRRNAEPSAQRNDAPRRSSA